MQAFQAMLFSGEKNNGTLSVKSKLTVFKQQKHNLHTPCPKLNLEAFTIQQQIRSEENDKRKTYLKCN